MRITRLALQNWKNFKQVELRLGRRTFIVGPNAAGKSNLLDAFRFARDVANAGGLERAVVELRGGVSELRSFVATRNIDVRIEFDLGDDETPATWTYSLLFRAHRISRMPEVHEEKVYHRGRQIIDRPDSDDKKDPERLSATALEQINSNKEFRDIADFLTTIRYFNPIPQIVRDPRRSIGSDDPHGGDLIDRINATGKKSRDARLKRMEEALRIAVPQLSGLELEVDTKGVPHLRAKYEHWRPAGAWQRERHFSDGTLRLLGLIWALQEKGGPLLLEEPEISLNSAIVERLGPLIAKATRQSKRQAIITTHSRELLDNAVRPEETYILEPTRDGTVARRADENPVVEQLTEADMPLGEALEPFMKAQGLDQLSLLDIVGSPG